MTKEQELEEIARIIIHHAREFYNDYMTEPTTLIRVDGDPDRPGVQFPMCRVAFATTQAGLSAPRTKTNYVHILVRDPTPQRLGCKGEEAIPASRNIVPKILKHANIRGKADVVITYREFFDICVPGTVGTFDVTAYPARTTVPWYEKG